MDCSPMSVDSAGMSTQMRDALPPVAPIADAALAARLQHRIDRLTKPVGELGRLEALMLQMGLVQRTDSPQLDAPQMVVFAADHGLAVHAVSAYPSEVTGQMVQNFLGGGAAVSVLARQHGLALTVVDAGVRRDFEPQAGLVSHKIGWGTADALHEAAMTALQCLQAIDRGRDVVRALPGNVIALGEMGIGNTSAAALLLARLTGWPIDRCTGRGSGLDADGVARKTTLLASVLARHEGARMPLEALAAFGGFEIAMLVGAALQAASERRVVLVDGFIASSAVLVASRLVPEVLEYCVFAHASSERAHAAMLEALGAEPLLHLSLRLGEGSGAALAWPLLDSACRLLNEMASFESAGVSDRSA